MPKTHYLNDNFINLALRNTPFTPPADVYLALFTVAPDVSGGGTEVSGGSYLRQVVTFSVSSNGQTSNTAEVLFPIASSAWGTVVSLALMDAVAGGNMMYFGSLNSPRTVLTSDQIRFPAGQLVVQET
jgi:hypothetical protein